MRVIRIIEYKSHGEKGMKWLKETLEHSQITFNAPLFVDYGHIKLIDEIIEKEEVIW